MVAVAFVSGFFGPHPGSFPTTEERRAGESRQGEEKGRKRHNWRARMRPRGWGSLPSFVTGIAGIIKLGLFDLVKETLHPGPTLAIPLPRIIPEVLEVNPTM